MFLKRLEIQGFKSFPEKVKLNFKEGVTAVVGPNGSGKSNISDAIRWVLGEQSAKSLRGDKMEDIMFTGTKNRKPLGFSEVSITLDNLDKKLNLEFDEITVTRKVYRSGESGYYINGAACRLKDIHELFMDTGIGKEGYSIIGQGKIDAILSNKSEDRRLLFEEAAGIIKFKNRRLQTENKLQEVKQNLIRTNDIIAELERQIKPLELQNEKAKEYLVLAKELKLIIINIFKYEYKNSEIEIEEIDNYIKILIESIERLEDDKKKLEINQENFKQQLIQNENAIQCLNEDISKYKVNLKQKETSIEMYSKDIQFIKNDIERIKKDNLNFENTLKNKQQEINLIHTYIDGKTIEYNLKQKNLDELLSKFEQLKIKNNKNEETIKSLNNDIIQKMLLSSELSKKISIDESSKKQYEERKKQIFDEKNILNSKLNEKNIRKEVLQKIIKQIDEKENTFKNNIDQNNILIKKIDQNLIKIKNEFSYNDKIFTESKQKLKIFQELEKDYEGYFNSVKSILKEKENNPKFSGIYGAIGELITVPKKYEIAIEIALGNSIQNIITKTEEDAKMAINYLKEYKKGRATFLPISSIKPKNLDNFNNFNNDTSVIGIASTLIEYDEKFYNIISSLLGKVVIIDNINNAIYFSKKYNYSYKVVTLDGELINVGGALTGGSIFKKTGGIFSRNREISDINQNILILENELKKLKTNILENESKKAKIISNIENENENIKAIFEEKTSIKAEIVQNENYIIETLEKIKNLEKEDENLNQIINFKEDESLLPKLNKINNEINQCKTQLLNFENELEKGKTDKDFQFNEINNLKISINSIKNDIENKTKDINRIKDEINISKEMQLNFKEEISKKETDKNNIIIKIEEVNKEILNLKKEYENITKLYEEKYAEKANITKLVENFSSDMLDITRKIGDVNNQMTKALAKKENIEDKIERFVNNIWEEYEITYADACNDFENLEISYDELKIKEKDLKNKITSLGTINVSAIEEYKLIKERYNLNISQKEDILKADNDLKKIIYTLTQEMEMQFKKQFSLINKNFKEVFSTIFGGGTAKLTLTDEENILNSGIEIVAQPPGKNLQSLTLLSGGERTLTAISLLFGILKMKPSPFCILDETEAALDDANVTRYANFLKKFSKDNQFILITHKTGTMEIADILYGVTMEEQGVSKVISVELKDAKDYNKNK